MKMKNIKLNPLKIILLSLVTIVITTILVFSIGHKKILDELIITVSMITGFLFFFLLYGLYRGVYFKSDIDYKKRINYGNTFIKKGIKKIFDGLSTDFPINIDIPVINIIFAAVGFVFPFFFVIIALSNGLGVGAGSAISRGLGSRDKKGADNVAVHTMILMVLFLLK